MADRGRYDFIFEVGGGPRGDVAAQFRKIAALAELSEVSENFGSDRLSAEDFLEMATQSAAEASAVSFILENVWMINPKELADAIVEAGFSMRQVCINYESETVWTRFANGYGFDRTFDGDKPDLTFVELCRTLERVSVGSAVPTDTAMGREVLAWMDKVRAMMGKMEQVRLEPSVLVNGPATPGM